MEKRQLVRTFGTALATATLSFGLFAAPALAVDATVQDATVTIAGKSTPSNAAKKTEKVEIELSVSVSDMDKIAAKGSTMTFKASNGTFDQKITLPALTAGEDDKGIKQYEEGTKPADKKDELKNKFAFVKDKDDNEQTKIAKIIAVVEVDAKMLNGTWTLDEIKFVDEKGDDLAKATADVSFVVTGNDDPAYLAADVESITVLRSTVIRTRDNWLMVNLKHEPTDTVAPTFTGTATYVNPAGEAKDFDLKQGGWRLTSEALPTGVEGSYTLTKLAVEREDVQGFLTTSVTYDDIDLSQGDYVVTKTGVEAMVRLYNPYTGEHIYTNDGEEQIAAVVAGWKYEGLAWYAPVNGLYQGAVAPVYRVYNQYNGEHHFTTSNVEALALVAAGWTDEGTGFYTTTKGDAYAQPVYRLFNQYATVGTHHYTISLDEYDARVADGWTGENVGWYGVKPFGDLKEEMGWS